MNYYYNDDSVDTNNMMNVILTSPKSIIYKSDNGSLDVIHFLPKYDWYHVIITVLILGVITLCTIFGNIFVVFAVCMEKNLQSVSNYLIISLAVTDLMVAILVMPLSILDEIGKKWWLGIHLCDVWVCFDVMCCTASILHLVAIAIDRLLTFINIQYVRTRKPNQIYLMICSIWILSIVISIPARFYSGRNYSDSYKQVVLMGNCTININHAYTIFSTVGAFYLPMLLMVFIYIRIYQVAKSHIHKKVLRTTNKNGPNANNKASVQCCSSLRCLLGFNRTRQHMSSTTAPNNNNNNNIGLESSIYSDTEYCSESLIYTNITETPAPHDGTNTVIETKFSQNLSLPTPNRTSHKSDTEIESPYKINDNNERLLSSCKPHHNHHQQQQQHRRTRLEQKRERKAVRTLAIVTGCFLLCWLPFFINALVAPLCGSFCHMPVYVESLFLWLGYINSMLNPIIYTIFSPEFRMAFKKLVFRRR